MVKASTLALSACALLGSVAPYVVQAAPIHADDSVFERDFTHDIAEVFERQYYPMYAVPPPRPVYYRPPAYGGYHPGPSRLGGWARPPISTVNNLKPTTKPSTTKPAAQPTTPAKKPDNKPKTRKDSKKNKKKAKRDFIHADFDIFERDFDIEGRDFEFELEQREPILGGLFSGVADIISAAKGKKRQPATE
ncbi:hypothetical protein CC1G_02761 [Coprinopsis cinerea okayama7|uniref:Uncharacterized protein n=1 Tax=Coprinopsis cinerea (strain Okayama-7 / 130 / ATCC MYA-4618 / FGSC 9003) TaxID=240176 RepID=A8MZV9_COPC7|nr:hypothetical protein CC1G_02761 [Coprinopsis cinerea okayama7\|eukprot:XP_001828180.1 hypothetical protein CC1G_02761 [Coprinopsis cinerea okayama7\